MKRKIDPIHLLISSLGLCLFSQKVFAHEGHHLDLVAAFLDPFAGWDHLLMLFLFVGLFFFMLRSVFRGARKRKEMHRGKNS